MLIRRRPVIHHGTAGPGISRPGRARTLLIVPGYNEPDSDMDRLISGRNGIPGFTAHGFDCVCFPRQADNLHDRIDRFADFLERLKRDHAHRFPVVLFGYSLGGVVVRGFLRAFPERSGDVSHTVQVGAPNWGMTTEMLPQLAAALRIPDKALPDIDVRSLFMKWLNGSGGAWARDPATRERLGWRLERPPIVAPPGARLLSIVGTVPRFGDDNDGIIWNDSSTLGGAIPSVSLRDARANHLNLVGLFSVGTLLLKGLRADDRIWPRMMRAVEDFVHHVGKAARMVGTTIEEVSGG